MSEDTGCCVEELGGMASKQGQDPYTQRGKQLASSVQKLRGWVGSDPSRTPELADALVALTW